MVNIVEILVKIFMLGLIPLVLYLLFEPISIIGDSMHPTIHDGDILLISKLFYRLTLKNIYVFKSPVSKHEVVKRLTDILPPEPQNRNRRLYFLGDNAEVSLDSRMYGFVEERFVVGKVIFHVRSKKRNSKKQK